MRELLLMKRVSWF